MNRTLLIAIGILIAFCAGIYFWTEWQKKEFDASLPKPPAVEEQQVANDTVDDVAGDTTGGHWHGDEWHAEPHPEQVSQVTDESKTLTATNTPHPLDYLSGEEREEWIRQRYALFGLEPPPKGYEYLWDPEIENAKRDESGSPILHRIGEPIIDVKIEWTRIGFAPTAEQYEQYLLLEAQFARAEAAGDTTTARRLADELKALEAEAQGELPVAYTSSTFDGVVSPEEVQSINSRYITEALERAYRERGLEHLIPALTSKR